MIYPLQRNYIQLNFYILTIDVSNTNWDVKMNKKVPTIIKVIFLNSYETFITKILEYWKDFLVCSSLRWWTMIVCVIKTKWHKQTEKSWYNIIVTHNCNSKNHLHRHIFPRSKMICQRSGSLTSYMLIHHHQKSPVLRHISTRLSWMLRFNTDWF